MVINPQLDLVLELEIDLTVEEGWTACARQLETLMKSLR